MLSFVSCSYCEIETSLWLTRKDPPSPDVPSTKLGRIQRGSWLNTPRSVERPNSGFCYFLASCGSACLAIALSPSTIRVGRCRPFPTPRWRGGPAQTARRPPRPVPHRLAEAVLRCFRLLTDSDCFSCSAPSRISPVLKSTTTAFAASSFSLSLSCTTVRV